MMMRKVSVIMENNIKSLKPFVKWAGGKRQLLSIIRKSYPEYLGKTITKYVEPFIGGGAVLFDILSNYQLEEIYISDINFDLINTYKVIRDKVDELILLLAKHQKEYIMLSLESRKTYFYEKRERYNLLKTDCKDDFNVEKAALFISLNKICLSCQMR